LIRITPTNAGPTVLRLMTLDWGRVPLRTGRVLPLHLWGDPDWEDYRAAMIKQRRCLTYGSPAPSRIDRDGPFSRDFRMVMDRKIGFLQGRFGYQWAFNSATFSAVGGTGTARSTPGRRSDAGQQRVAQPVSRRHAGRDAHRRRP
jgi:hypothetical protein